MNKVNYQEARSQLIDWLKTRLIGPFGSSESNEERTHPLNKYVTGVIFPIIKGSLQLDNKFSEDEESTKQSDIKDAFGKPNKERTIYQPPSSAGFSFCVAENNGTKLSISGEVNVYKCVDHRSISYDEPTKIDFYKDIEIPSSLTSSTTYIPIGPINNVRAKCMLKVRPHLQNGYIVTLAIVNVQEIENFGSLEPRKFNIELNERALFGVQLSCIVEKGVLQEYPRPEFSLLSEEEQELDVRYRDSKIYGVGHGASVNWISNNDRVNELCLNFLPSVEVPQVTADIEVEKKCLQMTFLSGISDASDKTVIEYLETFADDYQVWIKEQKNLNNQLSENECIAGSRITSRMDEAYLRMKSSIRILEQHPDAMHCFKIANRAMLEQMKIVDINRGKAACEENYCWRPFQLAFLLTVLESVINEDDNYRDVVDLIWFPTGGGKTEAYLGVISLLIAWRRKKYPTSGNGTCVIMRYTLRLLATQQFDRACLVTFALEKLRRSDPSLNLGEQPITIGLWVGGATSPNTYKKAQEIVEDITHDPNAKYKLVLHKCPWCQTEFNGDNNYVIKPDLFYFVCSNSTCDFGGHNTSPLPCTVVDEELYRAPPSILFGTVDKFARLTREERAGVFFGGAGIRPPELIVQDELHLISSELGSITGLYEAGIETILQYKGVYPKYIASTATIRNASEQVLRLYGKDVSVFPPPGLSSDDSYFAKTVPVSSKPGRLYIGYMPPMLNRSNSLIPLAVNLLIAPYALFSETKNKEALLDAWWTQVVYHNSLASVGKSQNAFNYDISKLMKARWKEDFEGKPSNRKNLIVSQLTSLATVFENAKTFYQLENRFDKPPSLDAVLATNMVSVGLDVSRLALMVINGQPLTTAEYIQTSSRVGRGEVPGIVVANLYNNQARSLSHYENFRAYHESFYRFVEPTSVTPFTYQSRKKALPAALVLSLRHCIAELSPNAGAFKLDLNNSEVNKVIQLLKIRLKKASPKQSHSAVCEHVDQLIDQWAFEVDECINSSESLVYVENSIDFSSREVVPLLSSGINNQKGLWNVMNSMRHVEATGLLES